MKTKGFTLIELLATIAILMIILLIAVPRILDMMETARREAFRDTAYLITHTGKLFSAENPGDHEFYYSNSIEYNADGYALDYSGTKPVTGIVLLNNNGKIAIALHNGTYCATKGGNETLVTITTVTPINCTVENIINTDKTWTEIATNWDIDLDDLLDINDETDPDSPTEGLDIIIPVNITGSTSSGTGDPETDSFTKTYYSMGYVTDEVSFPYSFDYTIELGVLPMDIADITSANVTAKSVFETLTDFKRYIIKRNIGEVIWPGADPVEIDIDQASIFQAHANTSDNMTVDDVTVTCDAETCEANIEVTVNNITGIDLYNINGNDIAYTPLKFTVEFNGVEELGCPSNPQPDSCFTFASGTISDYDVDNCPTDVVIPCTIGGTSVTTIGDNAFSWYDLTSVEIPNTVTTIEAEAFENNLLTEIVIPDSVTSMGEYAFSRNNLTSATLSNNLTAINDYAFYENYGLTSANIPNGVISIGTSAFENDDLASITIPNGVTSIGDGAFARNNLTSVTIPNSVTTIYNYAFLENALTDVTLGTGLVSIGDCAFNSNLIASNIIIANSVTNIGDFAFQWNLIPSVTFGTGITYMGIEAFNDNQLPNNQAFIYARNPDGSVDNTTLVSYGGANRTNVIIPTGVTTINKWAMAEVDITNVTIPTTVTTIVSNAFYYNHLTSISLPSSVATIGDYAFSSNQLTSITINNASATIGNYILYYNNNYFRDAYTTDGVGTYTGTQTGSWTKQ